ncbi:MAG TPA: hypothetical protein VMU49_01920 [Candidatus Acidoferrales bacterium]|nr:hypothetical protein [Candidatus Acidoferrales bacterium]
MAIQLPPPPGAEQAYDVAAAKLADQLKQIDSLDQKLGVVIGAIVVAIAAFAAAPLTGWPKVLIAVGLAVALAPALAAFLVGQYEDAPRPEIMVEYADLNANAMKWQALGAVLRAFEINEPKVRNKGRLLNISLSVAAVLGLLVLLGKGAGLA